MKEYTIDQLFATRWEELSRKQIIKIIRLSDSLLKYKKGSVEYGLLMIEVLRTLRKRKSLVAKISVDQALDIFNDLTFFHRDQDGSFKTPWLFFPVDSFKIKGQRFTRPEMNGTLPMYDLTFSQLCFADASFSSFCLFNHKLAKEGSLMSYLEKKQCERDIDESINSLIAVLYTSPEAFDEKYIDQRAQFLVMNPEKNLLKKIKSWLNKKKSLDRKALILHTYANVRAFITNREAALFPKKETTESSEETTPQFTGEMWMNLRFDLAKTDVFKGFEAASSARIYDALDFLDKEERDAQKRKQHDQG